MKIAILSDAHGNLVSLEAVLTDLDREQPDRVVFLGDATFGPRPSEVLGKLRELGCECVLGNTERWVLDNSSGEQMAETGSALTTYQWCASQLSGEDLDFLRAFRQTVELPLDAENTLLCFHGSPRHIRDVIVPQTSDEEFGEMVDGYSATVMAGGHVHKPMIRRFGDRTFINPGSVGMPGGQKRRHRPPFADYAILDWEDGRLGVDFRRLPVDLDEIIAAAHEAGMPDPAAWTNQWVR